MVGEVMLRLTLPNTTGGGVCIQNIFLGLFHLINHIGSNIGHEILIYCVEITEGGVMKATVKSGNCQDQNQKTANENGFEYTLETV